jgi:hypothetical protein
VCFSLHHSSSPHEYPESHEFPVYPVSNTVEFEKELQEVALRNACIAHDTARLRRWQLERDIKAVEKRISRKLAPVELINAFNLWHAALRVHLDPKKTFADYLAAFLAELGKVRVSTGEALTKSLEQVSSLRVSELPELPGIPNAPEKLAQTCRAPMIVPFADR